MAENGQQSSVVSRQSSAEDRRPATDDCLRPSAGTRTYQGILGFETDLDTLATRWRRIAAGAGALAALGFGLFVWQVATQAHFVPMVQPVQVTEGRVELLGTVQPLLQWQPPDGVYHDMLKLWVRLRYWRHMDADLAQLDQHWVTLHTCGEALQALERQDRAEDPRRVGARKVQVSVDQVRQVAVARTRATQQWHVEWTEMETYGPTTKEPRRWSAVYTVGRVAPTNADWFRQNKTGVCVLAFSPKEPL